MFVRKIFCNFYLNNFFLIFFKVKNTIIKFKFFVFWGEGWWKLTKEEEVTTPLQYSI